MPRVYNFSAGPAVLPESVLAQAKEEMLDWQSSGMSVMEMSHRGKEYVSIAEKAEADLREIMRIPANYKVLFLQGGASSQFSMVPMNLLKGKSKADYFNTGIWSKKAIDEAKRYCTVNIASSSEAQKFLTIPDENEWRLSADAAYVHYTPNETIGGLEFNAVPDTSRDIPLVADMSSTILSRPVAVDKFGVIYAGAQKNIGPAGLTLVIVRDDLIGESMTGTPTMFQYATHAENQSMYNTPPTFAWYLSGLVFQWLKDLGGLEGMSVINQRKAQKLYQTIDDSSFYNNPIDPRYRSRMNVPFTLADAALDKTFLDGAKEAGLVSLEGHRSVGGMRASIYNAMPEAGVDALVFYMKDFEARKA